MNTPMAGRALIRLSRQHSLGRDYSGSVLKVKKYTCMHECMHVCVLFYLGTYLQVSTPEANRPSIHKDMGAFTIYKI